MNRWVKLCVYLLTVTVIICGTVMLFLRGVIPDTNDWTITHETDGDRFIRIETGEITEDYLGQYIAINTLRQHLSVFLDDNLLLSSNDYGYTEPIGARYSIRVTPEFVGKEMRIVFSSYHPDENFLMREALSFQRINAGSEIIDYSIIAICIVFGIAAIILAFAIGIRNTGSGAIFLFAVLNFALALNVIGGDTIIGYEILSPRHLYIFDYSMFFVYMLPLLVFFYLALTGVWKKFSVVFIGATVLYAIISVVLNLTRILPFGLTDGLFNYVLSLSITVLTFMLAIQPKAVNRFAIIARIHLALWAVWGISAAVRFLIFAMNVLVNIEYRIMYSFAIILLTFFGIYSYAERIKVMQEREQVMNVKTNILMQNYEQINDHIHEVNSLKHDMRNHLTALNVFLKDDRYDEAKSYLDKYAIEVGEVTEAAYHSNYLINAMIHDLQRRSEVLRIKTTFSLKASPNSISDPDIVSLMTNIIENAVEACMKLPEERERYISLSITRREPYLAIVCENSNPGGIITGSQGIDHDENDSDRLLTSKNIKGHGDGLRTIERIAASYGGMMEISYDDDQFTITVALKDSV